MGILAGGFRWPVPRGSKCSGCGVGLSNSWAAAPHAPFHYPLPSSFPGIPPCKEVSNCPGSQDLFHLSCWSLEKQDPPLFFPKAVSSSFGKLRKLSLCHLSLGYALGVLAALPTEAAATGGPSFSALQGCISFFFIFQVRFSMMALTVSP